jgi:hypothetical protein
MVQCRKCTVRAYFPRAASRAVEIDAINIPEAVTRPGWTGSRRKSWKEIQSAQSLPVEPPETGAFLIACAAVAADCCVT